MEEKEGENGVAAMAAFYQGFDPATYLQNNYSPQQADLERKDSLDPWTLACLHRAFTEGDVSGELLVDIGSGSTLYQVMSGCEVFNKVLLTDFLEVNRQELRSWLQDEGGCRLDWTPFLQHVCKLEGRPPSAWTEIRCGYARSSWTLSTLTHRQPSGPDVLPQQADCLMSSYSFEGASPDKHIQVFRMAKSQSQT
ncbi:phenylethanolamine N-methyltransferase-like [Perca fluviatilis]|uniref:phenylethanolamine N-methyltransferase-like n=1 Tax=Perca fluviatilis TaxID=8168 RepID=UPI001964C3A2|nr:phenylethanolamine N-methyltransferase-like [Perca fluviatilis]